MMKFNYKGKEYQVEEPTVEMWSKLTLLQEWTDEREFCLKLLSFITGLTEEDIENSDYMEVVKLSTEISTFLNQDGDKFYNEFSFNNKNYRFLDLPNLIMAEQEYERKQSDVIRFRVSGVDKARIERKAIEKGYDSVSGYVRDLALR